MGDNGNIDVRMSNFLTILGNPNLIKNFDSQTVRAMEQCVAIYATSASMKFIHDYEAQQKHEAMQEQVNGLFK